MLKQKRSLIAPVPEPAAYGRDEAAARVSGPTRQAHPEIPLRQIIGLRHRIVHDYMDVDYDIVWEVVTRDLPPPIRVLEAIVPPAPRQEGA